VAVIVILSFSNSNGAITLVKAKERLCCNLQVNIEENAGSEGKELRQDVNDITILQKY
jgi:hypothetical protein